MMEKTTFTKKSLITSTVRNHSAPFLLIFFVDIVSATNNVMSLQPIAAQSGSQWNIDVIELKQAVECNLYVFEIYNFTRPWRQIDLSSYDGRYIQRNGTGLAIRSVHFGDAGLLRLSCSDRDYLQFLTVFDNVSDCKSNVTGEFVEIGQKIQTTCEFRYSAGMTILAKHWTTPIDWTSTGPFEDCTYKQAAQDTNRTTTYTYRACVVQTASAPEVPQVSIELSYRDFKKIFRQADRQTSSEAEQSVLWRSTTKAVRHAITEVRIQQEQSLFQSSLSSQVQTYTCLSDGFPKPDYRWLNVEKNTYSNGATLNVVFQHQTNNAGWFSSITIDRYVCIANNSFGEKRSLVEIQVPVSGGLSIYVYGIMATISLVIICLVVSNVIIGCRLAAWRKEAAAVVGSPAPVGQPSPSPTGHDAESPEAHRTSINSCNNYNTVPDKNELLSCQTGQSPSISTRPYLPLQDVRGKLQTRRQNNSEYDIIGDSNEG